MFRLWALSAELRKFPFSFIVQVFLEDVASVPVCARCAGAGAGEGRDRAQRELGGVGARCRDGARAEPREDGEFKAVSQSVVGELM